MSFDKEFADAVEEIKESQKLKDKKSGEKESLLEKLEVIKKNKIKELEGLRGNIKGKKTKKIIP